jgi:hypothetical protein
MRTLTVAALVMASLSIARADESPFQGTFAGHVSFDPAAGGGASDGSGAALHLGQTALHSVITLVPDASVPPPCFHVTHVTTLTAANGDTVTLHVDDITCPITATRFHGVGSYVVVGGTGRFAGVGGSGTLDSHPDLGTGTFIASLTGVFTGLGEDE